MYPVSLLSPWWWFFFLLFVALAGHRIYVWTQSAYALTDRRILSTAGLITNSLRQASLLDIEDVKVGLGVWRNITFRVRQQRPGWGGVPPRIAVVSHAWLDVPDPVDTANYCSQALPYLVPKLSQSLAVEQEKQVAALQVAQRLARMIYCPYCGTGVDVTTLTPEKHDCPACGAPLTLPNPVVAPVGAIPPPPPPPPPPPLPQ